jgi:seryl-tRNA synthetase
VQNALNIMLFRKDYQSIDRSLEELHNRMDELGQAISIMRKEESEIRTKVDALRTEKKEIQAEVEALSKEKTNFCLSVSNLIKAEWKVYATRYIELLIENEFRVMFDRSVSDLYSLKYSAPRTRKPLKTNDR